MSNARAIILVYPKVHEAFLVTDACIKLPSKYGRYALPVDTMPPCAHHLQHPPPVAYRLVNVHLDSLGGHASLRYHQMEMLADPLREPGCTCGIIAGDFLRH